MSFSNKGKPNKSYYISLNTVEKNEEGIYTPYKLVLYRAYVQKSFELTQSNTDNPMSIKFSFVLLQDKNNGFMDMIEITDEQYDNLLLNDYVITSDGILTSIKKYKIPTIDSNGVISFNSDPFLTNDGILVLNNISWNRRNYGVSLSKLVSLEILIRKPMGFSSWVVRKFYLLEYTNRFSIYIERGD